MAWCWLRVRACGTWRQNCGRRSSKPSSRTSRGFSRSSWLHYVHQCVRNTVWCFWGECRASGNQPNAAAAVAVAAAAACGWVHHVAIATHVHSIACWVPSAQTSPLCNYLASTAFLPCLFVYIVMYLSIRMDKWCTVAVAARSCCALAAAQVQMHCLDTQAGCAILCSAAAWFKHAWCRACRLKAADNVVLHSSWDLPVGLARGVVAWQTQRRHQKCRLHVT